MRLAAASFIAVLLSASGAYAQTAPLFQLGQVPSVAQWQQYFGGKVDTNGGALSNGRVTGSSIDNSPIGQTTPSFGLFTTFGASGPVNLGAGGTLAGTFNGGTFSGGTWSGGNFTGTVTGSPTFSGNPTFSGSPIFSGSPTIPGASVTSGLGYTPANRAGDALSGTFTGNPTFSGNPNFSGAPTGAATGMSVTPTGGSFSRFLGDLFNDVVNVKNYAKGDTTGFSDGTISASGTTLTSNSATFSIADVGKAILLHGSGTSGAPQQGTITAFNGVHSVSVSFTAANATPWSGSWSASVATPQGGSGSYAPGDTLTVSGGTGVITAPVFAISTTRATSATVNAGGAGGTNGACTITGTTGTGTKFQATGTVTGNALAGALTVSIAGSYTANPTSLTAEPVTGCSLTGATVTLKMGVLAVSSTTAGQEASLPSNPVSTTTNGSGTGATLTLTGWQMGGQFSYGTDDTAAFTTAAAAAVAAGKCLYLPSGAYWLASQTTSIPAGSLCVRGEGAGTSAFPYIGTGANILIANTATAAFSGLGNARFSNLSFYYPAQDGSGATPTTFPALFEVTTGSNNNNWFDHIRVANAYWFLHTGTAGGIGRTYIDNSLIYAVDRVFYFQNGFSDVVVLNNDMFGPGGSANLATSGAAMLGNYTLASGHLVYADVSSGGYTFMDGLILNGDYVLGYRYGIRMVSGGMDVSSITGSDFDSVGTAFELDNSATVVSTQWSGGFVYSTNTSLPSQNAPAFYFNQTSGAHNSDFSITGVHVAFALGPVVKDQTGALRDFEFSGNIVKAFGRSTTSATYYAFQQPGGGATVNFTDNNVNCSGSSNTVSGLLLSQATTVTSNITGNTFTGCGNDIVNQGSAGTEIVTGNISSGTVGATVNDISTGTSLLVLGSNQWDKAPSPRAPAPAACGTGATVAAGSSNERGVINVGTGGVTSCTLSFTTTLPYAPIAVSLTTDNSAVVAKLTSAPTTSAFVAGLSADLSSGHIYYQVGR